MMPKTTFSLQASGWVASLMTHFIWKANLSNLEIPWKHAIGFEQAVNLH